MNFWLCIVSDYQVISVVLCDQDQAVETVSIDKTDSNKLLLTRIKQLLNKYHVEMSDLSFIGVNLGPGPYTSLRVAIATVNGLAYATGIKLVGIDGMRAFLAEHTTSACTVALLNAFNQELFYGIKYHDLEPVTGYASLEQLKIIIDSKIKGPCYLIGNGVDLYREQLSLLFPDAIFPEIMPAYASISALVVQGWQRWQEHATTNQVFPLYLKELSYKNSIQVK